MQRLMPLLLAIVLAIGGEYQITHTSGRTSFCRVEGVTPEGDYVVRHPKMVRYNSNGQPVITWDKGWIVISGWDITEAKLLRPPRKPEDNSWNRLNKNWIPQSEINREGN